MAYSDDISNLGADHHWPFQSDATDSIGTADGTGSGVSYVTAAIALDGTQCLQTDGTSDYVDLPTASTLESSAQERRAIGGWFATNAIQDPPCAIYREGDVDDAIGIYLGFGNNVILEAWDDGTFGCQRFTDRTIQTGYRPYHLLLRFSGNNHDNVFDAFLDGVKLTDGVGTTPGAASIPARTNSGRWGSAEAGAVGGASVVLTAPVNGRYKHWCSFTGADIPSDTEARYLFERGAVSAVTISSNTEANMQTALDAYSSTTRPDWPVCIDVEAVSGGGDFTLDVDDITFSDKASLHIRYLGTSGTLTLRNINGSNASIVAAPFGGSVELFTEVSIKVTAIDASDLSDVQGARVRLVAAAGGALTAGTVILTGVTDVNGEVSGTFDYAANQPVTGVVRKGTSSPLYKQAVIGGSITANGYDVIGPMPPDEG